MSIRQHLVHRTFAHLTAPVPDELPTREWRILSHWSDVMDRHGMMLEDAAVRAAAAISGSKNLELRPDWKAR